jgi:hypothetical protein
MNFLQTILLAAGVASTTASAPSSDAVNSTASEAKQFQIDLDQDHPLFRFVIVLHLSTQGFRLGRVLAE